MKRRKNKTDSCLNCGRPLDISFDYCPACGQENNDRQISFRELLGDFFANYFSFDSRFGRSIYPFFLKPGTLTSEFMAGKRVHYANPIRLYLVLSLVHFFFLNLSTRERDPGIIQSKNTTTSVLPKPIEDNPDILTLDEIKGDTLLKDSLGGGPSWPINQRDWQVIREMTNEKNEYTVAEIEDAVHNTENTYITRKIVRQIIKLMKADLASVNQYLLKNIPIMMFFLLPVFALLLKLLFRKRLYINHLIHSLHLHSFAFVILTIMWISEIIDMAIQEEYILGTVMVYLLISLKNTYQLKWKTAIGKSILIAFGYSICLTIGLAMEILISLLFY